MDSKKNHINRRIALEKGNYNESISGNYIQGNVYYTDSEKEQAFPEICKNREHLNDLLAIANSRKIRNL